MSEMIKKKSFHVALSATVLVLASLGIYLSIPWSARSEEVPTETVTAETGDVEKTVEASGNVMMRDFVDIGAKVSGQVISVTVNLGDTVKAGRALVDIAPVTETGRVDSSRAQLTRLRAELAGQMAQSDFAQLQFQRQTQLKAENATREEAYESSRMNMQAAAAKVDAIQAQIEQLEASIKEYSTISEQKKITAPISGTVVAMSTSVGQMVTANRDVLMRISDLSKMTVQVPVAETDVTRLRRGMVAYFTTPGYPGKNWSGKLKQIMLLPVENTGRGGKKAYYNVLFDVENPDGALLSGMTADVRFLLDRVDDAVTIPASLVTKPDEDGMQTLKVLQHDGTVALRKVKIGLYNTRTAQVVSGLEAGERVVVPASGKH